jgi:hypothetical protein
VWPMFLFAFTLYYSRLIYANLNLLPLFLVAFEFLVPTRPDRNITS